MAVGERVILRDLRNVAARDNGDGSFSILVETFTTYDNLGAPINPDAYAQTLSYNGDGTLNTTTFTNGVNTWTQTMSYTSGKLTGVSGWVRS